MIGYIEGTVQEFEHDYVLLNVHDIGYIVYCAPHIAKSLQIGDKVAFYVEQQFREDAVQLFGFTTKQEKKIFQLLKGVHGIGAKLAITILGELSVAEIIDAIGDSKVSVFERISGIGKKIATRMVTELNTANAFKRLYTEIDRSTYSENNKQAPLPSIYHETLEALIYLGFNKNDAQKTLDIISQKLSYDITKEQLLQEALKSLSRF
ncbi:Holliday junction ATP-dependent DNA helicase RuvA [Candidatus Fokinia solitaria]|uniref:Holliday junction branch migration complex subunit RuvA n=1 Tax=Candidatus Fokinia solitaria TaxID=1802984 RepID=A0A2U8BRH6_9RICK|nr:Holliday junction branch migration protein RuvA [Candidatus Fokinia solitaria]AWD32941.1 Holliday junction ATP-dependent DNA helicase RuvA [Candidatus Fokinia solitaria]